MHGNSNYERTQRKERNSRPPRGNEQAKHKEAKHDKQWKRESNKREWETFDSFR